MSPPLWEEKKSVLTIISIIQFICITSSMFGFNFNIKNLHLMGGGRDISPSQKPYML